MSPLPTSERARRRRRTTLVAAALIVASALTLAAVVHVATSSGGRHRATRSPPRASAPAAGGLKRSPPVAARRAGVALERAAVDRLIARQGFIAAGGRRRREIALTFDDGPGPYTPALLDVLERLHVPATFFEIGKMIPYFSASLRRQLRNPSVVIGDHTETHPAMARLSRGAQEREILAQARQLERHGGPLPRLYRPPYRSFDRDSFAVLRRLRMLMVLWTVDTEDYEHMSAAAIADRALAGARSGAIILMHDGGGDRRQTVLALPTIVRALRARGYKLVTVPRLVLDDPPEQRQRASGPSGGG